MTLPVLTAVADARAEAQLAAGLAGGESGVRVVRRCVDLPDLLAAAAAGLARAAVVSADLRRLDRDALNRLAVAGLAVVVLSPDERSEVRMRQLGVRHVLPLSASASLVRSELVAAVGEAPGPVLPAQPGPHAGAAATGGAGGRVVAVWGPTGAPGRSTVAVNLAAELAGLGRTTLLVDADAYGGVVAQLLGILDEAPGLAAACRLANNGSLDRPALAELAVEVVDGLRVLTGITRPDRWPELRPSGLDAVLAMARGMADEVVVDCGFCLEDDEALSYDTQAPRRNGATLAALGAADVVVAVAGADPVGLQRFVRAWPEVAEAAPQARRVPVVNRVRPAAVGAGDAAAEIGAALQRFAGIVAPQVVPADSAVDAALAGGRTLAEAAPTSPARLALQALAADLAGTPVPQRRRRLSVRRRQPV